jgi:hypothetical protein
VFGRVDPLVPVELELRDAARTTLASAATTSDEAGAFASELRDAAGAPVEVETGQSVEARLEGVSNSAAVPLLEALATWTPTWSLEVRADAGTSVELWARPGCRPGEEPARMALLRVTTDATGQWRQPGRVAARPGSRHELAVSPQPGWRFYRLLARSLLVVTLGEAEVIGCAAPSSGLGVAHYDPVGAPRGAAAARVASDATFRARLEDPSGAAVTVQAGDVLRLAAGDETVDVHAEPLWARLEGNGTIQGGGSPDRELALVFHLPGGRVERRVLRTGPEGGFRLTPDELPLEADWSPHQAERIVAYMATTEDHVVGAVVEPAVSPVIPRRIHLPMAMAP